MSRIGKQPVAVPQGLTVKVSDRAVTIKGAKSELTQAVHPSIQVEWDESKRLLKVSRKSDEKQDKALHGLTRALLNNMVLGVIQGYSRSLEIHGVGYQAKMEGKTLVLTVGFSHPVRIPVPAGLEVQVTAATNPARFTVRGADKQLVGEFAAEIRHIRPPEPYQAKGIRYTGEVIRRKAGKTFVSGE